MKIKKGIISVLLALIMLVNMVVPVFAQTQQSAPLEVTVDTTSVKAGDAVTITFKLLSPVADVVSFNFYVEYDSDVFEYDKDSSYMPEQYIAGMTGYNSRVHKTAKRTPTNEYFSDIDFAGIEMVSPSFAMPWSMPAGDLYVMVLRAKTDVTSTSSAINLNSVINALTTTDSSTDIDDKYDAVVTVNGKPSGMDMTTHERNGGDAAIDNVSITITDSTVPTVEYTVDITTDEAGYNRGETAYVDVNVSKGFASSELILTYDSAVLTFDEASSTLNGATVKSDTANNKIVIERYGSDITYNENAPEYKLAFDIKSDTNATSSTVTLTSAGFSEAQAASASNLSDAVITTANAVINIYAVYNVTLPEGFSGDAVVPQNQDYTFTAQNQNYNYTFNATMGGTATTVTDNGNGTYTIANVTGDINVAIASQTGKTHSVTISGDAAASVTAPETATYGTDYVFTIAKESGYSYPVTVTIGGTEYTGDIGIDASGENITVTIPGNALTGDIGISVGKVSTEVEVKVSGATADVDAPSTANKNEPYTFTVNRKDGYDYTVTIKVDGTELTADDYTVTTDGNIDTYTIKAEKVTGMIEISVTRKGQLSVEVYQYLTLDGKQMYLVLAKGTLENDNVFTYCGTPMYHSEKYDAYCYLVIPDGSFDQQTAAANVATAQASFVEVNYGMDVNMSSRVDANDAQLVYNMYNTFYSDFTDVSMEKFLRADVNYDKTVNVNDSNAIINFIIAER